MIGFCLPEVFSADVNVDKWNEYKQQEGEKNWHDG